MAATNRARVERAMVLAMRVVVDEEGEGNAKKDGVGNKGGRSNIAFACGFLSLVGLRFIPYVLHRDWKWSLNSLPLSYII